MIFQKTISKKVSIQGVGLHSGDAVTLSLLPAKPDSGITFVRKDLNSNNTIKVDPFLVSDTRLCSTLEKESAKVMTVEHLMSALYAYSIDNIIIEISGIEVPILDGSSNPFIYLIQSGEPINQEREKKFIKVKKALKYEIDGKFAMLEPYDGFKIDFSIDFPHPVFADRNNSISIDYYKDSYVDEIARARTFGFMQEVEYLRSNGLAKGGSLDNAIVMDEYKIINNDRLRYEDEFVRHKVLDAFGDLYLTGHALIGKFSAFKSGHEINNQLLRLLMKDKNSYDLVSLVESDSVYQQIINHNEQLELIQNEAALA
ncbi:MAG: UDP-3-O-acyl-N-acetylglucosamine deacetylase [Betaproteobacteria bacterium]|jgi:UDP-3-O-[3-hydroxymyristoyl] N-acetylglucosamine deacetylase|nr:UDP-3-O-acyl-N-acetylglucosamine deacetylase [Methylophilaceae bacterium]NCV28325.1 UDP-3-O-acyl-N-acetylglucosamine deacetylase [Nitrosomonadales bacterium]NCV38218.1 UDP-3-O-acyl-N-acetylglucosamine deacetylase [Betaproteobacteria bacterium]NCX68400.1 UDP-3-O-acyl-N-acetylglucosamine deacetylase [Betaproteobacteria bacterium]